MLSDQEKQQVKVLFDEYKKTQDTDIRNQIVEKYLYLVDILVKKYLNKGVDYDDLYQIGSMALVLAVKRFDPAKGFEFSSFATPTIIGEIKRYFRDKSWSMKVPRRLKEISIEIPKVREDLHSTLGRVPTILEIAQKTGYSEEEILEAMEAGQNYSAFSLNQALTDADEETSSSLEQYTGIPEQGYENFENADLIKKVMAGLSDREKQIFEDRLLKGRTQQDVAAELGVSQMTVSRLEKDIKGKFRAEYYR